MKADEIHKLFTYHFALNRKVWDEAISQLSDGQFMQQLPGSSGSVRDQIVHLIEIDRGWFEALQGEIWEGSADPALFPDRESVRAHWDQIETMMAAYLDQINDKTLAANFPPAPVEIQNWQVLFQVVAHGIDHRAHLLDLLNQLGVETFDQDYVLYLFGGIWPVAQGSKWVFPPASS